MRVLVCGGRFFNKKELLTKVLDNLHKSTPIEVIIEGDAPGADRLAGYWARKNKIDDLKFKADWDKFGRSAGPIRNRLMLKEGKPDMVIAFEGGAGTANMIKISKEANVQVEEINE